MTKGLDTLWDKTVDLYDKIRDVTSLLNKGKINLEAPVVLPNQILPVRRLSYVLLCQTMLISKKGKYYLEATVYIKDHGQATCRIGKDVHDIY